jgi:hypothetical protein
MPPDRRGGPRSPHREPATTNTSPADQHLQGIAAPRHAGSYAYAWREGFGYGFRDALRLAARRLPPECWHVMEALASEYELAGSDG